MNPLLAVVRAQLGESLQAKQALLDDGGLQALIVEAGERLASCVAAGGKVLFMGNGGSAADAQHLAGELVSRFAYDRRALAGLALTTDTSVLTAIGNDYGYEHVFARQVAGLGRKGDCLVAITTSGNSPNILSAVAVAGTIGITTIGMTGRGGGKLAPLSDIALRMPSDSTPRVQECHIAVGHILCSIIESRCCVREGRA